MRHGENSFGVQSAKEAGEQKAGGEDMQRKLAIRIRQIQVPNPSCITQLRASALFF
jgi:hypothetical protein